jgi:hypothetical protein
MTDKFEISTVLYIAFQHILEFQAVIRAAPISTQISLRLAKTVITFAL